MNDNSIKRFLLAFLATSMLILSACNNTLDAPSSSSSITSISINSNIFSGSVDLFEDALGRKLAIPYQPKNVVALQGSFAELWELAGGKLIGITSDALEENRIKQIAETVLLGTNHEPNLELLLSINPDFIILSADLSSHLELEDTLNQAEIPHIYLKVDSFSDYLNYLNMFCLATGRPDLYEEHGQSIAAEIDNIKNLVYGVENKPRVLLLRAMSSAVKARGVDIMAGEMIAELAAVNIIDDYPSLLEDLSLEIILMEDPEYILALTMGDTTKALAMLDQQVWLNPAWTGLSAMKENRYHILPRELFHFKPNARWAEAYHYLAEILYPNLFSDD